jgi:hypothetical protein
MTALFALAVVVPATVTLTDDQRRRVVRAVREAIQLSKQTMRQAAQEAEIDQAQFQRQIEMAEGSLKRLAMQPEAFWQWLGVTIAAEFGMPADAKRAARLALASMGLKRMARAGISDARKAEAS